MLNNRSLSRLVSSSSYAQKISRKSFATEATKHEPRVVVESNTSIPGLTEVILNRPDKLNALDIHMFRALRDTLRKGIPPTTRCIILRGKGRSFSAGLDVGSLVKNSLQQRVDQELLERYPYTTTASLTRSDDSEDGPSTMNLAQEVAYGWRQVPVPVLCVVQGHCYGGGLQIALGADIRYACAETTRLSVMESAYGIIPDMSASVTLRELVRIDVAKELTFTGRVVDAAEGETLGLVTCAVKDPLEKARETARTIIEKSPDALRLAKQLYQTTWRTAADEEKALQKESEYQKQLLLTWNQMAASGRKLTGVSVPYSLSKNDMSITPKD